MTTTFPLELLQAVSDWQRGPSEKKKIERGNTLKELIATLPAKFRSCDEPCFRQEAHEKGRTFDVLIANKLDETVAAWTTNETIAQKFKGGVPPLGLQGIILRIMPPPGSVVANLKALYSDQDFVDAMQANRSKIDYYENGAGKYGGTQDEVVLELGHITEAQIYSYGGYAGPFEQLVVEFVAMNGHEPSEAEQQNLAEAAGGAWWLSEEGTRIVIARTKPQFLKRIHQRLPRA
ncbi:MAG: hypothetical protein VYA18_04145 [Pseudomonadota bacterium]|nr:hypothetical protein [Pseudomonadota bacterium]